ncbi:phage minor head protein [Thalassococcus sp. S3]|uniref:phage minor head protein n=1 Tax=Thalassococcus sp. S3 TaxID=2017482 RepID=UPI0010247951|nr:phage minor head protein [Thalassococcus sp. S3]QBF31504.1 phage head protein [Thalassococcus sp. S3]
MSEAVRATLRRPFPEQVAAFRTRLGNLVPTSAWDDLDRNAHDRAFVVAGATKQDLLADLGAAVDRAISEGTGFEAFKKDFRSIVEKHGWHGWTGEGTERGENWRMRVIYQTNMRTSMAAGRLAQLRDGQFRFWVYRHSGAENPRLLHLSWDGLVLPADHPFWATHYPPNEWGCGCYVRGARTERGARRVGGDPDKALPDNWNRIDPKTGTPPGIGKGWDYRPGDTADQAVQMMAQRTVQWPYQLQKAFMEDLPEGVVDGFSRGYRDHPTLATEIRRWAERVLGVRRGTDIAGSAKAQPYWTLGRLDSDWVRLMAEIGLGDVAGYDFSVSDDTVRHVLNSHGDAARETARGQRAVTAEDYARIGPMLNTRDAVTLDDGRVLVTKTVGSERFQMVFERRAKRRMLSLVTMWIERR